MVFFVHAQSIWMYVYEMAKGKPVWKSFVHKTIKCQCYKTFLLHDAIHKNKLECLSQVSQMLVKRWNKCSKITLPAKIRLGRKIMQLLCTLKSICNGHQRQEKNMFYNIEMNLPDMGDKNFYWLVIELQ